MTHTGPITDDCTDANASAPARAPGLNLDARQRAMLEEMGVQVWWPGTAPVVAATAAAAPARTAPPARAPGPHIGMAAPAAAGVPLAMPAPQTHRPAPAAPVPAARQRPGALAPAAAPLAANAYGTPGASGAWTLQPPQALFPNADPQHTPVALGAGWLIVVEGRAGSDPLAGDAGRLLENMLRALQLHHHPRAFVCLLDAPPSSDAPAPGGLEMLQSAVAAVQPAVLLLLGRTAARVLLGRSEPLGQLRTAHLEVAGVPAVVGYDTPYLLRAPQAKAQAWADLCRARALAGAKPHTGTADPHS